jgi:kynurenine 3-monooxygenase
MIMIQPSTTTTTTTRVQSPPRVKSTIHTNAHIDPRKESSHPQALRSINLAISARGITALKSVDEALAEELLGEAIPMSGRMIHHKHKHKGSKGSKEEVEVEVRREAQAYDPKGGEVSFGLGS